MTEPTKTEPRKFEPRKFEPRKTEPRRMEAARYVNFANVEEVQRKAVRGLLKKRAKNYNSDSDGQENDQKDQDSVRDKKGKFGDKKSNFAGKNDKPGFNKKKPFNKNDSNDDGDGKFKKKKIVLQESFQDAFNSIMGNNKQEIIQKNIQDDEPAIFVEGKEPASVKPMIKKKFKEDDNKSEENKEQVPKAKKEKVPKATDQVAKNGPILSKYKRPAVKAQAEKTQEEEDREKKLQRNMQRAQGRKIPNKADEEHERNLVRIATKGVVELFNTVREFQNNTIKEAKQEQKDKDIKYQKAVQAVGEGGYANTSNQNIIKKLQEQPSRWSVLNPDEGEDESDLDSEGNIKIKEYESD